MIILCLSPFYFVNLLIYCNIWLFIFIYKKLLSFSKYISIFHRFILFFIHDYNFCITTPPIFAFYSYMLGFRSFMQRKKFTCRHTWSKRSSWCTQVRIFNTSTHCPDSYRFVQEWQTGIYCLKKRNSLVPSFLSGGQKRNDDGRKNIIWLLAKNPA